ncbi:hypothetical protein QIS74_13498 [Colletotrichum tabaci]|uniref:Uncharacterized protein n=1 Tax=Colletotrichum tabaci TaxID=1209068 RepID=A0AAV9SWH5_9PEZI
MRWLKYKSLMLLLLETFWPSPPHCKPQGLDSFTKATTMKMRFSAVALVTLLAAFAEA